MVNPNANPNTLHTANRSPHAAIHTSAPAMKKASTASPCLGQYPD